ncbi:MAG: hypothetical protein OEZ43_21120 [Gammaproteobacteria bacterium]|nr:hypothetical protein [Gammaproteobacteria bacterium]
MMNSRYLALAFIVFCLMPNSPAHAKHRETDNILPLSMFVGVGMVTPKQVGNTQFNYSRQIELATLYRVHNNFGVGIGFNLMSRSFDYQGATKEYSIDTLFTQFKWHPRYSPNSWGVYLGSKVNIHVVLYGEIGGLDSTDEDAVVWGVEPLAGILIPLFYSHLFLDISASYQLRQFPVLYHQPEASRQRNVQDNVVILQASIRF